MKKLITFSCAFVALICCFAISYAAPPPPAKHAATHLSSTPTVATANFSPLAFVVTDDAPQAIPWQQLTAKNVSYAIVSSMQMSATKITAAESNTLMTNRCIGATRAKPDNLALYCKINPPPGCVPATPGGKEVLST